MISFLAIGFVSSAALMADTNQSSPADANSDQALNENLPNTGGLEEIVVTAQRREQSLKDVPVSVTAFTSADIEKSQLQSLNDYAALVPNFKAVNFGVPGDSNVSIRGVSNIGGQSSSIAFYNDEFGVDLFDFQLNDVDRIEVLRGPQGTLFGRNTIAGAVNIVYKKPVDRWEAAASFEGASYDSYEAFGMVNVPLIDGKLLLRSSVSYAWSDGYLRDIGIANNSDDYTRISGRFALRGLFGRLTLDASYAVADHAQSLPTAVPTGVVSGVVQGVGIPAGLDDGQEFFPDNLRSIATDVPSHTDYRYDTAILRAGYDLGRANLIVIGGRQSSERDVGGDFDRTESDLVQLNSRRKSFVHSIETRLQSMGSGAFSWLVGGSYQKEKVLSTTQSIFTAEFLGMIGLPSVLAPFYIDDNSSQFKKETLAGFGQVGWKMFDDRLSLDASIRYTDDRLHLTFRDDAQVLAMPIRFSGAQSYEDVTPKASISFAPTPEVNLYATVSRGYKSGGFNTAASQVPGAPVSYGKESAYNYEVGLKSELFDRKLRLNFSGFVLDWKNIQVLSIYQDPSLAFYNFTQNAASASIKGVEVEMVASPIRGLNINANVGFNDAKFNSFTTAIDRSGNSFDATGNRIPLSSKWQLSTSADYAFDIGSGSVFGRAEYSWASGFYQSVEQSPDLGYYIGGRGTLNLRAGWRGDGYSAAVFAENLGGDDKALLWDVGNFLSGYQAVVRPERVGIRVSVSID